MNIEGIGPADLGPADEVIELPLRLVARDIGATYGVELWAGSRLVFAKRAQTGHSDTAIEAGTEMVLRMLRGAAAAHLADETDYDPQDPVGDNAYLRSNPL